MTNFPVTVLYTDDGKPLELLRCWVQESSIPVGPTQAVTIIPENPVRIGLSFMVVGQGSICVKPIARGQALQQFPFGQGKIYDAGGAGNQGSGEDFAGRAPCNGFAAISNGNLTVYVWEYFNG
jgi:hypothetical protein